MRKDSIDLAGLSRRELLKAGSFALAFPLLNGPLSGLITMGQAESGYLADIEAIERWIRSQAVGMPEGMAFIAIQREHPSVSYNLYTGTAGVLLFYLDYYNLTQDPEILSIASRTGHWLATQIPVARADGMYGLYMGLAGMGFVLQRCHEATKDSRHLEGALECLSCFKEDTSPNDNREFWTKYLDVIYGGAGIVVYLWDAYQKLGDPSIRDLAISATDWLIEHAEKTPTGLRWSFDTETERYYPNFSHGTAGVVYAIATTYGHTGEKKYLDAALDGTRHLLSLSDQSSEGCIVPRTEGADEITYSAGWCHGPVGTGKTFLKLEEVTGTGEWLDWAERSANTVLNSELPKDFRGTGWNNRTSVCHGDAGVIEYLQMLWKKTGKEKYRDAIKPFIEDMLKYADRGEWGMRWPEDDNGKTVYYTSYMIGAVGLGRTLVHLTMDAKGQSDRRIILPDSPT